VKQKKMFMDRKHKGLTMGQFYATGRVPDKKLIRIEPEKAKKWETALFALVAQLSDLTSIPIDSHEKYSAALLQARSEFRFFQESTKNYPVCVPQEMLVRYLSVVSHMQQVESHYAINNQQRQQQQLKGIAEINDEIANAEQEFRSKMQQEMVQYEQRKLAQTLPQETHFQEQRERTQILEEKLTPLQPPVSTSTTVLTTPPLPEPISLPNLQPSYPEDKDILRSYQVLVRGTSVLLTAGRRIDVEIWIPDNVALPLKGRLIDISGNRQITLIVDSLFNFPSVSVLNSRGLLFKEVQLKGTNLFFVGTI